MTSEINLRGTNGGPQLTDLVAAAGEPLLRRDDFFRRLVNALPAAVYTTDAAGRITYFNQAAADLWGCCPELDQSEWCGSWKLYWPDGRPLPHDQCPMAVAVKEKRPVRGVEAIAERPDGTRVPFIPYPTPIFDDAGEFIGAVNLLVDITDRKHAEEATQRLAAIVESSDDAIVSKNLDGIITSWNRGAERIFGYLAEEIIGRPIKTLIPLELHTEEDSIIERIRRGERIEHYETVRQRKYGGQIEVSLTVSPLKDSRGKVIGASKIARDISERKRAEMQLATLGREAEHRTKNVLATVQATVHLTNASTVEDFKHSIGGRIQSLANVHSLFVESRWTGAELKTLVARELAPYLADGERRTHINGPKVILETNAAQAMAIAVHELATNAAKYGALSQQEGRIDVAWALQGGNLVLRWTESGGPPVEPPKRRGFGTRVLDNILTGQLGGEVRFDWRPSGLDCEITVAGALLR
jgi:PAS domain S-box-containing protein